MVLVATILSKPSIESRLNYEFHEVDLMVKYNK